MSLLNIGVSALTTAQTSLATVSHNISNVNTEGYNRQRAEQVTQIPDFVGGRYIGSGVTVGGIERVFDAFLSNQVRTYTSQASQAGTFVQASQQIDNLLSSPEVGLNSGLEDFFNAVHEVANDPTSISARTVMLSQGELLANRFNTLDQQINNIDKQIDNSLTVSVQEINNISKAIAELNVAIVQATGSSNSSPNDLLDQRDKLINDLSEFVSVETLAESTGAVSVFVGSGQALVVGSSQIDLHAIADTSTTPPRVAIGYGSSMVDISAQLNGGSIGGSFQVRTDVIDTARADLNTLASAVVSSFNTVQTAGIDLDGNAGTNFFDPTGTTAGTINVILTDPRDIAASSTTNSGVGNNLNALAMADLQTAKTLAAGTQTYADAYGVIVANVATRTHQADVSEQTQVGLLNQVKLQFDSKSGVNLDEEAANLIKLQQAYQAASQIITVSNTIFNALLQAV
ncbi:MAG: flagellar hook-associated protein FlgK [Gammaproteobacteria bacterium]|nr:flagellar hook-associated protein FlgK [Gammaproteobacteria bacterium]